MAWSIELGLDSEIRDEEGGEDIVEMNYWELEKGRLITILLGFMGNLPKDHLVAYIWTIILYELINITDNAKKD